MFQSDLVKKRICLLCGVIAALCVFCKNKRLFYRTAYALGRIESKERFLRYKLNCHANLFIIPVFFAPKRLPVNQDTSFARHYKTAYYIGKRAFPLSAFSDNSDFFAVFDS